MSSGGTSSDTNVGVGQEVIKSGGTAISTTVGNSGGWQIVESGGTADGTIVLAGRQDINPGGLANNSLVGSGGDIADGGISIAAVLSGGTEHVGGTGPLTGGYFTGVASGTTVESGGTEIVNSASAGISGGTAFFTIVSNGGTELVRSDGTDISATVYFGGTEIVSAGGTASAPIIDGGTVELAAGSVVSGAISFGAGAGTLGIGGTAMPGDVISGFAPGDTVDLAESLRFGRLRGSHCRQCASGERGRQQLRSSA